MAGVGVAQLGLAWYTEWFNMTGEKQAAYLSRIMARAAGGDRGCRAALQLINAARGASLNAQRVRALRAMTHDGSPITLSAPTVTELLDLWESVHGGDG